MWLREFAHPLFHPIRNPTVVLSLTWTQWRERRTVCAVTFRFRSLSLLFIFYYCPFLFSYGNIFIVIFYDLCVNASEKKRKKYTEGWWYGYCVKMLGLALCVCSSSLFFCFSFSGQPTWWNHNEAQNYNRIWVCVCVEMGCLGGLDG